MRIGHCILNRHYQFQPGAGRSSSVSARPHGGYAMFRLVEMVSMPAQRLLPRVIVVFRLNRRATRRRKIPRARFCPLATFGSQDHAAGASTYPPSKRHSQLAPEVCLRSRGCGKWCITMVSSAGSAHHGKSEPEWRRYGCGVTCDRGRGLARGMSPYPLPTGLLHFRLREPRSMVLVRLGCFGFTICKARGD